MVCISSDMNKLKIWIVQKFCIIIDYYIANYQPPSSHFTYICSGLIYRYLRFGYPIGHYNQGIHYWFYLAFENSNCPDYITEKLWRILDLPVVPIVMGGGNYRRDAPPHSVIDVNDFPHVKALASYLNFLMENPVRFRFTTRSYYKYIKLTETWNSVYPFTERIFEIFCLEKRIYVIRTRSILYLVPKTSWSLWTSKNLSKHDGLVLSQPSRWWSFM